MKNFEQPRPEIESEDMKIVNKIIPHLINPCECGPGMDIRYKWLKTARTALETMEDPMAIVTLQDAIKMWERFEEEKHKDIKVTKDHACRDE